MVAAPAAETQEPAPDDGELEVIETAGMIGLIVFSDLVFRFVQEHAS